MDQECDQLCAIVLAILSERPWISDEWFSYGIRRSMNGKIKRGKMSPATT